MLIEQYITNASVIALDTYYDGEKGTTIYTMMLEYDHTYEGHTMCYGVHRYSEWLTLFEQLRDRHSRYFKKHSDIVFPPKCWFFSNSESVVEFRNNEIGKIFNELVQDKNIVNDEVLIMKFDTKVSHVRTVLFNDIDVIDS